MQIQIATTRTPAPLTFKPEIIAARKWQNLCKTTPAPNAVLIDWRFQVFTLELFERTNEHGEIKTGSKFASCTITGAENPKPKKNKNKTILFALPIL
jgi:hypothetical protein